MDRPRLRMRADAIAETNSNCNASTEKGTLRGQLRLLKYEKSTRYSFSTIAIRKNEGVPRPFSRSSYFAIRGIFAYLRQSHCLKSLTETYPKGKRAPNSVFEPVSTRTGSESFFV